MIIYCKYNKKQKKMNEVLNKKFHQAFESEYLKLLKHIIILKQCG